MSMHPETLFEKAQRIEKIKYLPKITGPILDIGGGDGSVWNNTDYTIDCIEPDIELASRAKASGNYRFVFNKMFEASDLDHDHYELVTVLGVLEHIEHDYDFLRMLAGAPELYLTVPNAESFHRYLGVELGMLDNIYTLHDGDIAIGHHRVYDRQKLYNVIHSALPTATVNLYTAGFKFTDNSEMEQFLNRYKEISLVANKLEISGFGQFGAEIVAKVKL